MRGTVVDEIKHPFIRFRMVDNMSYGGYKRKPRKKVIYKKNCTVIIVPKRRRKKRWY